MSSDPATYQITMLAIGSSKAIPITENEFQRIKEAKKIQIFGLGIEEKIDLVLENYREFERDLLDLALTHCVFPGQVWRLLDEAGHTINRRLVNLLSTTRLYLDQVAHDLSSIYGRSSTQLAAFRHATHQEYDQVFAYRLTEALRNHVQHSSLPIHGISLPMDRRNERERLRYRVVPSISVEEVEKNVRFKTKVLVELRTRADSDKSLALTPIVREYVESIGRIHMKMRELVQHDLIDSDLAIERVRGLAKHEFGEDVPGLAAMRRNGEGKMVDYEYLLDRLPKRRGELADRNISLSTLASRFVSSQTE